MWFDVALVFHPLYILKLMLMFGFLRAFGMEPSTVPLCGCEEISNHFSLMSIPIDVRKQILLLKLGRSTVTESNDSSE